MKRLSLIIFVSIIVAILVLVVCKYVQYDIGLSLKYEEWDKDLFEQKERKILDYIRYCKNYILISGLILGVIAIYRLIKK